MKNWFLIIIVAALSLCLGIGIAWLNRPQIPEPGASGAGVGDPHPGFRHLGLEGEWVDAADFDGRAMLVNFWATWCAPCVREMPLLQHTAERHGADTLAVVGIAMDEPGAVRAFVQDLGIGYTIAVGAADVASTQRRWGNAGGLLPYTVFVDSDGIIRWQHLGEVTADQLADVLGQWLQ